MVCSYCATLLDPKKAMTKNRMWFHPECLDAWKQDVQALKDRAEAEVRKSLEVKRGA